jgi:phenylcoumaran benzylic ether reductase
LQRFLPSEFGNDVDRVHAVEPAKSMYAEKVQSRRAVEAEGIPYTFVSSNFFADRFLPTLGQFGVPGLPTDKIIILGDGNTKGT